MYDFLVMVKKRAEANFDTKNLDNKLRSFQITNKDFKSSDMIKKSMLEFSHITNIPTRTSQLFCCRDYFHLKKLTVIPDDHQKYTFLGQNSDRRIPI